ncbi:MAG TPA: RDD family protein [Methanoregula sp.]|nr:RDD family protein [Methanoregula sp.]
MFCPKCGKETDALGKFCQWCGADIVSIPATPIATPEEDEGSDVGIYAGLGRRIVAFIVDLILILLLDAVAVAFLGLFRGLQNLYFFAVRHASVDSLTTEGTSAALFGSIIAAYGIVIIIIPWLYFAGFESSRSQATPGKLLMRIVVTDLDGNKPSLARVTLRHFAKFISTLIIFLGFLMIGLTSKRQGLHDKIAGCLVLLQE